MRRQLLGTPHADVSAVSEVVEAVRSGGKRRPAEKPGSDRSGYFFRRWRKITRTRVGAYIEKGPNVLYIRTEGVGKASGGYRKIFVRNTAAGIPVYIRDVAEVRIGSAVRYGAMCFNDEGEVAGAVVMMLKGSNSSAVIAAVKKKIRLIERPCPKACRSNPSWIAPRW